MREIVVRWIARLVVIPVTAGYVALGVAVLTWRAVRAAAEAVVPPGAPSETDSHRAA